MDKHNTQGFGRKVVISPEAGFDLSAIYTYTYQTHGYEQAERYAQFWRQRRMKLRSVQNLGV
jgi:hypothetical protein